MAEICTHNFSSFVVVTIRERSGFPVNLIAVKGGEKGFEKLKFSEEKSYLMPR